MDSTSVKRFVKSLRYAEEVLVGDAKCFCYSHEPEFREIHEDIKMLIRILEDGSTMDAGKLLYKRARQISPATATSLAVKAKTDEERQFYLFLAGMNGAKGTADQTEAIYQTVIKIKKDIPPAELQQLTAVITGLFDNRAGKVPNTGPEPYTLVFKGNMKDHACLDLGTLALEDVPGLLEHLSECLWIDADPAESSDLLKLFKTPLK